MRFLLVCSVSSFAAMAPVASFAQANAAEEAVIQAFLQFDCVMTRETEDAVVAAMGLSEDASEAAGQALFAQGLFREVNDTLVMQHPDCPDAGSAGGPSGVEAAVAWMTSLGPEQSANVVAEMLAARGCAVGSDAFGRLQGEMSAAIGRRFGFDETALLAEEMDPYLDALVAVSERGVLQLVREARIEDGPTGTTLVGCEAENTISE